MSRPLTWTKAPTHRHQTKTRHRLTRTHTRRRAHDRIDRQGSLAMSLKVGKFSHGQHHLIEMLPRSSIRSSNGYKGRSTAFC